MLTFVRGLRFLQIDQRGAQPCQRILDLVIEAAQKTAAVLFHLAQRFHDHDLRLPDTAHIPEIQEDQNQCKKKPEQKCEE